MRFALTMNSKAACFATARDVAPQVSQTVAGVDFEPLAIASLVQLRRPFAFAGSLTEEVLVGL